MNIFCTLTRLTCVCLILLPAAMLSGCSSSERSGPQESKLPARVETNMESASPNAVLETPKVVLEIPKPLPSYDKTVKLIAVGDIMMHSPQIPAAYNPKTGAYSFDSYFTSVKEILHQGDWVMGNLETPMAGQDMEFSGYPKFNAPAELADALKNSGFNIITTANNHALDRGETGVLRTIDNLLSRGFVVKGTARSEEDANHLLMLSKDGISMALLAYTFGTNGIPIPSGKNYLVSLIDENKMSKDIAFAKQSGADIVTIALHFGDEYHRMPNDYQKQLVRKLVDAGADIVLGSHPHVVQPYDILNVTDKAGNARKAVVIYSLGNFISNQTGEFTDYGVIFGLTISKHFPEGTVRITKIETTSTWVHQYYANNKRNYHIVPLEAAIAARNEPGLTDKDYTRLQTAMLELRQHIAALSPTGIPILNR